MNNLKLMNYKDKKNNLNKIIKFNYNNNYNINNNKHQQNLF